MDNTSDFKDFYGSLQLIYDSALINIVSRLNIIRKYKTANGYRDPIENIKTRLKSPESMKKKLISKGLEPVSENIPGNINDAAGARVICTYVDDVYEVANTLAAQKDLNVITIKDYIKTPKTSGYRSYHMIIEVPIYIGEECHNVRAELQIRTLSMDFWASLEHKIHYKHDIPSRAIIESELRRCADEVASVEMNFITIRDMINAAQKEDER